MRIIFAGTPAFASLALEQILQAGHEVALVLTQPDRPRGRGLKTLPSAVKVLAAERRLAISQTQSLRAPEMERIVADLNADVMVVVAYGMLIPAMLLKKPRYGCINIHASLLPRWRGAAPIQRALLAGDASTGISIIQMDEGLDTGPILMQQALPITSDDNAQTLHDKLAVLGGELIVATLARLSSGTLNAQPQPNMGVTYATKLTRAEAELNWQLPATELARAVRAYNPYPVARSHYGKTSLRIWRARPIATTFPAMPGTITDINERGITVACGEGALIIEEAQRAGGKRLDIKALLQGFPMKVGGQLNFPAPAPS